MTNKDLNRVINLNTGCVFYQITNAEGKTWLIPRRNAKTALGIYQPSHWRGRFFKRILSFPPMTVVAANILGFKSVTCELIKEMESLLCEILNTDHLEFAIFCGTPSVHQKITIQLSCGKEVLGYCKVSSRAEIDVLFQREQETLAFLHEAGMSGIPVCLYHGKLKNGMNVFVQTTKKNSASTNIHRWNRCHDVFLQRLYQNTNKQLLFEQTDFYKHLHYLEKQISTLPDMDMVQTVQKALDLLMREKGHFVNYATCHGDFTPWNMFVDGDGLFVFDWEYSIGTSPLGIDYFHFFMQTEIFENHRSKEQIWELYSRNKRRDDKVYLSYLLLILSTYFERDEFVGSIGEEPSLHVWIYLIKRLTANL